MYNLSENKDKRIIKMIKLLQQNKMTQKELSLKLGVGIPQVNTDLSRIINEVDMEITEGFPKEYKINSSVDFKKLSIFQRYRTGGPNLSATMELFKEKVEEELKGKKKIGRSDFIDWQRNWVMCFGMLQRLQA